MIPVFVDTGTLNLLKKSKRRNNNLIFFVSRAETQKLFLLKFSSIIISLLNIILIVNTTLKVSKFVYIYIYKAKILSK